MNHLPNDAGPTRLSPASPGSASVPAVPTDKPGKRGELSLCNILFCLLVIFIHVSSEPVLLYQKDTARYFLTLSLWRSSSFVVQGFLFLSGVKLFLKPLSAPFSYRKFYLSRARRVVLPYAVAVVIFYLCFWLLDMIEPSPAHFLHVFFIGDLNAHFYFVPIICQFYLLIPLWRQMVRRVEPVLALLVSLLLMLILRAHLPEFFTLAGIVNFPYTSRVFPTYLFYFVAGCFFGAQYETFLERLRSRKIALLIGWAAAACVDCVFLYFSNTGRYYALWLEDWHVLYCVFAILLSLVLCAELSERGFHRRCVSFVASLDRASYLIYLFHPLAILAVNFALNGLSISSLSLRYLLRFAGVYGIVFLAVLSATIWKKRIQ